MALHLLAHEEWAKALFFSRQPQYLNVKKTIIPIYFSLWELIEPTIESFAKKFAQMVLESYKEKLSIKYKIKQMVQVPMTSMMDFLKSINIHINILDQIELSLSKKGEEKDYTELIEKVMFLPEVLAKETKTKAIIFLDEFPSIVTLTLRNGAHVGEGILKKIRTISEKYKHTVLCISGSIRKTMELTVLDSSSPFFRQFIVKNIGQFEVKDVHSLLRRNLNRKIRKEVSEKAYQCTSGIPFYLQFIGRGLLQIKEEITPGNIENIFYDFLRQEGNLLFRQEFNVLSSNERQIIYVSAKKNLTRISEMAKELNEGLNVVSRYLGYLSNKGIMVREERGIYKFVDPVFKRWIQEML